MTQAEQIKAEPVSEDLEEAVDGYTRKVLERINCLIGNQPVGEEISKAVKFGANWQKEQDQKTIELAEDHALLAGMQKTEEKIIFLLEELKEKYPHIQIDWVDNRCRVSLFDKDYHWKDEALNENPINALKELVKRKDET